MTQQIPSGIIAAFVTVVLTTALSITYTFAQKTESIVINEPNAADAKLDSSENITDRSVLVPVEPTIDPKVLDAVVAKISSNENSTVSSTSVPVELSTDLTIPPAVGVYMQHRFYEMRSKLLDDRAAIIDYWLIAITILLAVFAIIAVVVGYFGFQRFKEIESEAKGYMDAARRHAEATEHEYSKTKENRKNQEGLMYTDAIPNHNNPEETKPVSVKDIKIPGDNNPEEMEHVADNVKKVPDDNNPEETRHDTDNVKKDSEKSLIEKAIDRAITFYQQGLISDAVNQWYAVAYVAGDDDNVLAASAWFSVGYLEAERKPDGAIAAYDRVIMMQPQYASAYINRAIIKEKLGRYNEALADIDKSILLQPDTAEVFNLRGVIKQKMGNYIDAFPDHDKAIQLRQDYTEAYSDRGNAKLSLQRYRDAISDYDEALQRQPEQAPTYYNRGTARLALGLTDDALQDFNTLHRLQPDSASAYFGRGSVNAVLNNTDVARGDYVRALENWRG